MSISRDVINKHFDTIYKSPGLDAVENATLFLIAEEHKNRQQQIEKGLLINTIVEERGIPTSQITVLLEDSKTGPVNTVNAPEISCVNYSINCLGWDLPASPVSPEEQIFLDSVRPETQKEINSLENLKGRLEVIPKQIAEQERVLKLFKEIKQNLTAKEDLSEEEVDHFSQLVNVCRTKESNIWKLKQELAVAPKKVKKLETNVTRLKLSDKLTNLQLLELLKMKAFLTPESFVPRQESMMETIERTNNCSLRFLIAGHAHLEEVGKMKDHPAFTIEPLRNYLQDKKAVILRHHNN